VSAYLAGTFSKKDIDWGKKMTENKEGIIFDIQRWSIHDGPGIRSNVFFKGCPLRCKWCSNPESQEVYQELAFFRGKCIGCGRCITNCPYQAITPSEEGNIIDYTICQRQCYQGKGGYACTSQCYAKALKVIGEKVPLPDIMKEVLSDSKLYEQSGGGITVTGGEPFTQPDFLLELLRFSKEKGLHTTVETCAFTSWKYFEPALDYIDFLFVDFKLYDEEKHIAYTGTSNKIIKENLCRINEYAKNHKLTLVIRTPVITGINDSEEEIRLIAAWIKEHLSEVHIYQLLPYHRLGRGKYHDIGKSYELEETEPPAADVIGALEQIIRSHGLDIKYD